MENNLKIGRRNYTVDFLRVIFAILIVALHTSPFSEINFCLYYFICHIFSRLAVPFFAAVSGYYLFFNYSIPKACQFLKKLAIAFLFWNTISCLVDLALGFAEGSIGQFFVNAYLLKGQHALWYILAMIYAVALTMLVYRLKISRELLFCVTIVLLVFGVFINAYGNLVEKIPMIRWIMKQLQTDMQRGLLFIIVPYLGMGYLLKQNEDMRRSNRCDWLRVAIFLCLYMLEVLLITVSGIHKNNTSLFMTYPLVYSLIKGALHSDRITWRNGKIFSILSNVVYYSHSTLLYFVLGLSAYFKMNLQPTTIFCIVCIGGLGLGFVAAKIRRNDSGFMQYVF